MYLSWGMDITRTCRSQLDELSKFGWMTGLKTYQFMLEYTPYVRVVLFPTWHLNQAKGPIQPCVGLMGKGIMSWNRHIETQRQQLYVPDSWNFIFIQLFRKQFDFTLFNNSINLRLHQQGEWNILTRKVVERPSRQSLRVVNCQRNRRLHWRCISDLLRSNLSTNALYTRSSRAK